MARDSYLTPSSLKSATIVLSSCSAIVPDLRRAVSFARSKRSGRSSRKRTTQTRKQTKNVDISRVFGMKKGLLANR